MTCFSPPFIRQNEVIAVGGFFGAQYRSAAEFKAAPALGCLQGQCSHGLRVKPRGHL